MTPTDDSAPMSDEQIRRAAWMNACLKHPTPTAADLDHEIATLKAKLNAPPSQHSGDEPPASFED